jgi:hypothetical protein
VDNKKNKAQLTAELSKRYAPFADWQFVVDIDALTEVSGERYWRTPQEIAEHRTEKDLPLKGLRLVLDSGHVGGPWAAHEQREFKVDDKDFYVREAALSKNRSAVRWQPRWQMQQNYHRRSMKTIMRFCRTRNNPMSLRVIC